MLALLALLAPPPLSTKHAPFIETFTRNGKTLIYVLSVHHSLVLFPDAMSDPVFKTIQSVFLKTPPDAVIVEGVDPSQISGFLDHAKQCAAASYNLAGTACDENAFTAYSATENGAPSTQERSARVSLSFFEARGYSIQDFLAFLIMNNIPPEKRRGQLTEDKFRRLVNRVVAYENYLLGNLNPLHQRGLRRLVREEYASSSLLPGHRAGRYQSVSSAGRAQDTLAYSLCS